MEKNELISARRRLARRPEVLAIVGLSRSEIDRLEKAGRFPKRVAISPRCTAWPLDEVEKWVSDRIAERGKSPADQRRAEIGQQLTRARAATAA